MADEMEEIRNAYVRARSLALNLVEARARRILMENSDMGEFIMGMGTWMFTLKKRNANVDGDDPRLKPIDEVMIEWDRDLGISGIPTRFTAKGKTRRNW